MTEGSTPETVILFSARYLPSVGGVEYFTSNLGHQLAFMGNDVIVVTTEPTDDPVADARRLVGAGSFEVMRLHSWGLCRAPFVRMDRHYHSCMARIRRMKPFHALINTRFYDLSRIAARLCRNMGVRPILIDHGTGHIKFSNALISFTAMVAEYVITINLRRYPIDYYGVSRDASRWLARLGISSCGEIHNALDASTFVGQRSERDFRVEHDVADDVLCVTFAGRLLADKGADVIVEAARMLEGDTRLHFFIAGAGPMEQDIANAGKVLKNLTYVGMLNHPDLAALLMSSDVFCLPTRYCEGLPTSLLEAGACENALVASHAGGVEEVIPTSDHGIILASATATEVIKALRGLANDPEHVRMLKQNAQKRVRECFTWESTAQEVLTAFSRNTC